MEERRDSADAHDGLRDISGVSFLHLRSSVTERMKPDGHQSGLAHYAILDTRYDRAHRVEQTKT